MEKANGVFKNYKIVNERRKKKNDSCKSSLQDMRDMSMISCRAYSAQTENKILKIKVVIKLSIRGVAEQPAAGIGHT